jgi:DNA-binding NarL/FixJ family response regulator
MQSLNVALFQSDPGIAQLLAANLGNEFQSVHVARSMQEMRHIIAKHRPTVVILDMERSGLADVKQLHQEFPGVAIVCTHRLADEEMWAAALAAGADDIYPSSDTPGILRSALRNAALSHTAAA